MSSSRVDSLSRGSPVSRSIKEKTDSKDQTGAKTTVKAMSSIREQAIEKYTALTRHKRELLRKNQKIQTRIAQHLRKNKIELTSSTGRALAEDEEKSEYTRLLQELADIMENSERENTEFEQEMTDIQVTISYQYIFLAAYLHFSQGSGRLIATSTSWSLSLRASGRGS